MGLKLIPIFHGKVVEGKLVLDKKDRFNEYLKKISGDIMVVLKRPAKNRTLQENKYYWFMLELIGNELGSSKDEMHQAFKLLFLKKPINEKLFTVKSTSTLNTLEFEDYLENIRRFASLELNIYVPLPNEYEQ